MDDAIENAVGRFWLDEEGILRCVVKEGIEQTREQAEDSMRIFRQLAAGKRVPGVIELGRSMGLKREARATYASAESAEVFTGVALIVGGSAVGRALGNFMMSVAKPPFPMRLCDTVEEALPWARAQISKG